jgi:hypothetical protein
MTSNDACVQKLDKLRMDLEAGKKRSFILYVFPENPDEFEPVMHETTIAMKYTVSFDCLRQANLQADNEGKID